MKNDCRISRAIEEYRRRFDGNDGVGCFYPDDILWILDEYPVSSREKLINVVIKSLEAGFMIGFRAGQRAAKKKNAGPVVAK